VSCAPITKPVRKIKADRPRTGSLSFLGSMSTITWHGNVKHHLAQGTRPHWFNTGTTHAVTLGAAPNGNRVGVMPDDQTDAMVAIWEECKVELAQQNSDLDALRNRAVALLSVEALVGGLFGSRLPAHMRALNTTGLVVALVLFGVSIALAIAIAWPRSWKGGFDNLSLAERVADGTATLAQVNYGLVITGEESWATNHDTLVGMYRLFAVLCTLTGALVVGWALAVV
jgi:hypothetical protein